MARDRRRGDARHSGRRDRPSRGGARAEPGATARAAWNIQRGARLPQLAAQLAGEPVLRDADVLLLLEVDHGMGRSGNRHVARELAERLAMHYAFGVNYLALEDDAFENPDRAANTLALAGNAILSRWPIGRVVNVDLAGVLEALEALGLPSLVGGDLNTTTYDLSSKAALFADLVHKLFVLGFAGTLHNYLTPDRRYETAIFELLAARGYTLDGWNDRAVGSMVYDFSTPYARDKIKKKVGGLLLRLLFWLLRPWNGVVPARLDWFGARGLAPLAAYTVQPVRDATGSPASDHAAIVCDVAR